MEKIASYFNAGIFFLLVFFLSVSHVFTQEITDPCLQRLSQEERDQLSKPEEGMLVLNSTTGCINYFEKGMWREYCESLDKSVVGTVVFDTVQQNFKVFTGQQWVPMETFVTQYEMLNNQQEKSSKVEDETGTSDVGNGEIIASTPNKPTPLDDCGNLPTTAMAGSDQVDLEEVTLNANQPKHGIGKWIVLKGDSSWFSDATNPRSKFTGKHDVTYHLRWEISTKCDTSYDDVLIRIRFPCDPEPSQSYAGVDKHNIEVCYLNANVPKSGKGSWSIAQGVGGKVHQPELHNSLFTGEAGETYVLRWTIRTVCGLTQDDVRITFKPPCKPDPTVADAGEDQLEVVESQLAGNKPIHGNGKWYIVSGSGGKIVSPNLHNSQFIGVSNETYWLKWVISNDCGQTQDGVVIKFRKICPASIKDDRDGQEYATVEIGNQCWMADNLNYQGVEYFCYDGFPDNCVDYGALYTWESAMDYTKKEKSRGACPKGWHIPTDKEWDQLLKPADDGKVIDLDDFDLIYGGTRYPNGKYFNKKEYAFYWSSSANTKTTAWNRYFHTESKEGEHYSTDIENGFSVRCIQD